MDSKIPKLLIKARRTKPAPGQLGLFAAPAKAPSGAKKIGDLTVVRTAKPAPKGEAIPQPPKSFARKPPGGGWQAIPGGKSGGFRRKKGGSWEYWYPTGAKQKTKPKEAKLTARYFTETMEKNGWHLMSQGPGYQVLQSFDRTRNLRIDKTGHGEWKMSGESEGTFGDLQSAQRAALAVMKTKPEAKPQKHDVAEKEKELAAEARRSMRLEREIKRADKEIEERKRKAAEPELVGGLPFPVYPSDIPGRLAVQAHSGTSFTPEKRGEQEQQDYVNRMRHVWETYGPKAKTEEEKTALLEDLKTYQRGYISKLRARLEARSRTISPMITGPAKFPTRRNQKHMETERKRLDDLIGYSEVVLRNLDKKILARKVEAAGGEAAVMRNKIAAMEKRQEQMKSANKIFRSKKLTDEQKTEKLKSQFGMSDALIHEMLNPDWGPKGFAGYQLSNNNANIKRSKERLKELEGKEKAREAAAETGGIAATKEGEGWSMEENVEDDRIRLFFDEKPNAEQRGALKGSGWRWSPRAGAWQRKITQNARRSAEDILERHFGAKMSKAVPHLVLRKGLAD